MVLETAPVNSDHFGATLADRDRTVVEQAQIPTLDTEYTPCLDDTR
jgi:hypothetical protein